MALSQRSPVDSSNVPDGPRERFMELLDPVHDGLCRFARGITHSREEARDLVSETLLVAFERFGSLRDPQAFLSFLFTIAHRTWKRNRRRNRRSEQLDEHSSSRIASVSTAPDVSTDVAALLAAMERLPASQREAVALFELSGLSLNEIRSIQGGTLSGVKARVARGRRALARMLGADEDQAHATRRRNAGGDTAHLILLHTNTHVNG